MFGLVALLFSLISIFWPFTRSHNKMHWDKIESSFFKLLFISTASAVFLLPAQWNASWSVLLPGQMATRFFSFFSYMYISVTQVAKVSILDKLAPNITLQAQIDERRCICIKQHGSDRGEYKPVCGQCRDPCALRFIPRNSVEYLQKLTLGDNAISEVTRAI